MFDDLRIGWRSLWQSPLCTLTAAGSLALGIAACTVIFSVVYTLLLRPLPYPYPSELVDLGFCNPSLGIEASVADLSPTVLKRLCDDPKGAFSVLGGFNYDHINLPHVPIPPQLYLGIYGTMSYSVGQHTRELGIRLALGAPREDVLRLVLGQGTCLIVTGLVLGLLASLALVGLLKNLLYGVAANDPATLGFVACLLGAVALVASYLPARRATLIDLLSALREE